MHTSNAFPANFKDNFGLVFLIIKLYFTKPKKPRFNSTEIFKHNNKKNHITTPRYF